MIKDKHICPSEMLKSLASHPFHLSSAVIHLDRSPVFKSITWHLPRGAFRLYVAHLPPEAVTSLKAKTVPLYAVFPKVPQ